MSTFPESNVLYIHCICSGGSEISYGVPQGEPGLSSPSEMEIRTCTEIYLYFKYNKKKYEQVRQGLVRL